MIEHQLLVVITNNKFFPVLHYVMPLSVCIIYVTAIAFMCFANKHIIIIIIKLLIPNK